MKDLKSKQQNILIILSSKHKQTSEIAISGIVTQYMGIRILIHRDLQILSGDFASLG